jgi:hypothetical protein
MSEANAQVVRQEVSGIRNFAKIESTVACAGAITPAAIQEIKKMGYASIINLRLATEQGADIDGHRACEGGRHSLLPHSIQRVGAGSCGRRHVSEDDYRAGRPAGVHSLSGRWKSRRDVAHETRDRRWLGHHKAMEEATALGLANETLKQFFWRRFRSGSVEVSLRGVNQMATPSWKVNGQYYETCSCDFVCRASPLVSRSFRPRDPARSQWRSRLIGDHMAPCHWMGSGSFFWVLRPQRWARGTGPVGLIADEKATAEQRDAITAIASGAAGGPIAALSGLVGKFLGVESAPILFDRRGRAGRSRHRASWTWRRRASGASTRIRPSRSIWITPDILPPIVSRWRAPRAAAFRPSVSHGKI